MNYSVAVAAADALPSAFVVWRGFEESIRKAAACGYDGVELALRDAAELEPTKLRGWLSAAGLQVSCISTGQVFAARGLYFTHPDPEARAETARVFTGLVHLAADFGGLVNIGRARGFLAEGQSFEEAADLFCEAIAPVCDEAQRCGVRLIIEPVNRYEINFINSVAQGAGLVRRLGRPNVGLMPDVFHMNIEDASIEGSLREYADLTWYVHLADSNRLSPGKGHLNFPSILSTLREAGYQGWASVEILPLPDPDTAAADAIRYLRGLGA